MRKLILGPPGTGKTTTLLHHVDQCIRRGIPTQRIAYVSFTRKATYEAQARAIEKFDLGKRALPYFKTIHSICFSEMGIVQGQTMQRDDYKDLGKQLGIEFTGFYSQEEGLPTGGAEGDKLLFIDSYARATRRGLEQAWRSVGTDVATWQAVKQFSETLRAFKSANGLIDYTDMLELYLMEGGELPVDVAFIDEAQDLSTLQWEVVRMMMGGAEEVYIAGDDDQAIYKWSGADVEQFLTLPVDERVILNKSHRLPRAVYEYTKTLTARMTNRYEKEYMPNDNEGAVVHIPSPHQIKIEGDDTWLFLARNVYLLEELETIAHAQRVTYECRGRKSVSDPHVRAIKNWQRLIEGELLGTESVRDVYKWLKVGEGVVRGFKSLKNMPEEEVYSLLDLQRDWGLLVSSPWFDALTGIAAAERTYYQSILRAGHRLTGQPQVIINTIHGVKGGEADHVVVVPDMAYKTFVEYEKDPDDEHRVFYVAASRARKTLYLVDPRNRYYYHW